MFCGTSKGEGHLLCSDTFPSDMDNSQKIDVFQTKYSYGGEFDYPRFYKHSSSASTSMDSDLEESKFHVFTYMAIVFSLANSIL